MQERNLARCSSVWRGQVGLGLVGWGWVCSGVVWFGYTLNCERFGKAGCDRVWHGWVGYGMVG